jgi:hypothetical protein
MKYVDRTDLSVLIYGVRLCYQSWHRSDDLGPNDRKLLKNIEKMKHYSPFNLLWYWFEEVAHDDWLNWITKNPTFQHFCFYAPQRGELLVNARTLLEGKGNDDFTDELIRQVKDVTPVIFGDTDANLKIEQESIFPQDGDDYIAVLDVFPKTNPKLVTIEVKGLSRALLQQWIRHFQFPLVKSTRYTLKELVNNPVSNFTEVGKYDIIDETNTGNLNYLAWIIRQYNVPSDYAKYALPEAYKTHLVSVFPVWSLNNLLDVRSTKAAMWEWNKWTDLLKEELPKHGIV